MATQVTRRLTFALLIVTMICSVTGCRGCGTNSEPKDKSLTVCSYGGSYQKAQRKAAFEPFAEKFGLKVHEETYSGEFAKLKAMVESGNVTWDLLDAESFMVLRGAAANLLAPIDYGVVDRDQLLPEATHKFGVAWCFWSTVIGYNTKAFPNGKPHPRSWAEFWDVKKFPGPRALRRNPKGTLEFALLADGVARDKLYPLNVERALESLNKIKPFIHVWWEAGEQPAQLLTSGEVVLASVWNGRAYNAAREGGPVAVEWGQGMLDADWWVIPRGCQRVDLAMKFIAFASQAGPQASNTKWISYGPVNKEAMKMVDPTILPSLPTAPDNLRKQFMINTEWWAKNEDWVLEKWNKWLLE